MSLPLPNIKIKGTLQTSQVDEKITGISAKYGWVEKDLRKADLVLVKSHRTLQHSFFPPPLFATGD